MRFWIVLAASLSTVIAGCSGGKPVKDAEPAIPRVIQYVQSDEPRRLDPAFSKDLYEGIANGLLFDGLVGFGAGAAVEPRLADRWTTSPDGRLYDFHLRDGVTFHDGRPLRAGDVRYSFERLIHAATGSDRRWVLARVDGAAEFTSGLTPNLRGLTLPDGPDGRRVVMALARPSPVFLTQLAMPAAAIIPEGAAGPAGEKPDGKFDRKPVGTGPWVLGKWQHDRRIEFTRFPGYWNTAAANAGVPQAAPSSLVWHVVSEDSTRRRLFETGKTDMYPVGFASWEAWSRRPTPAGEAMTGVDEISTTFFGVQCSGRPALRDPAVRRGLAAAIDADVIFRRLQHGRGRRAAGPVPPGVPGFREGRMPPARDLAAAKAALSTLAADSRRAPLRLLYRQDALNAEIAAAARADLAAAGVMAEPMVRDQAALRQAVWGGDYDLFLGSWRLDYPDAEAVLAPCFHSRNVPRQGNQCHLRDDGLDRLIEAAETEVEPARRLSAWQAAEDRVIELSPWIPLFHPRGDFAVARSLKDWRPALMYNADRFDGRN